MEIFTTKSNLQYRDFRPFECKICDKTFKWFSDRRKHRVKEHDVTILPENGTTPIETKPASHKKRVKCEICEKSLSNKTTLKVHLAIDTHMKKYKCSVCLNSYRQKGSLIAHKISKKHGDIGRKKRLELLNICNGRYLAESYETA